MVCLTSPLLLLIIFLINNLMVREVRALKPPLKPEHLMKSIQSKFKDAAQTLTRIPLSIVVRNAYDFFYYLPRRNLLYDRPWQLFRNNTEQFLSWRQFPNQLPPYEYFGKGYPDDFFCYGLPGNTLPLGNWDPWGFQLVSKKVVQKYRESELKHGRLAMMAVVGFLTQESFHPLHPDVGGVAITHMAQLLSLPFEQNLLAPPLSSILSLLGIDKELVHVDYFSVVLLLSLIELWALKRNWSRWLPNEYNNQFDHNIGVGNLREDYENGDYGLDVLKFYPQDPKDARAMRESELNNGRLAMVAIIGLIGQEYLTGYPAMYAVAEWLGAGAGSGEVAIAAGAGPLELLEAVVRWPATIAENLGAMFRPPEGALPPMSPLQ